MSETPNFARLLGPFIEAIPEAARPAFLARLERTAAERYRLWAGQAAALAEGLLACAAREDEIADRVERVLGADAAAREKIEASAEAARDTYYAVFAGKPLREQLRIQADAERQGANAWRLLAATIGEAAVAAELEACAVLEEQSASHLEALLADPATPLD
jgi:hypothetical protein